MDVDFWAARVYSDKDLPAFPSARLGNSGNHVVVEDEGYDEVRAWFPCPFCYVEIEVPMLCAHLQEDHCFDLKNAVNEMHMLMSYSCFLINSNVYPLVSCLDKNLKVGDGGGGTILTLCSTMCFIYCNGYMLSALELFIRKFLVQLAFIYDVIGEKNRGSKQVCPICAANLGKDAIGHFTLQHAHSIKRRKNSKKSGFSSNVSTNIVKDLRELSSVLGTNSLLCPSSRSEPAPDPLLSPFFCTGPNDSQKDIISPCVAATSDTDRKPSPSGEIEGEDYEERKQRADFLQGLLVSTIFLEL